MFKIISLKKKYFLFNQGAKMAAPNRPSIAYVGDGAWGMSLNEMLTCVRENIPTIAVVFNNRQWGAEKKNQVTHRRT
jgi:sulfoacetaldehyde acetyltransferase